jgi:hypothetical protein
MEERYCFFASIETLSKRSQTLTINYSPPSQLDGHTLLYKAGTMHKLQSIFDDSKQALQFQKLITRGKGDFDPPMSCGLYFTTQHQAAVELAAWNKQVADILVSILCIAIPNDLLASTIRFTGYPWRTYVWRCRMNDLLPLSNAHCIAGPICRSSPGVFERYAFREEIHEWQV